MKIYKLSQSINTDYDTFDSIIVIAHDEKDAKTIAPSGQTLSKNDYVVWCEPQHITVELIGFANLYQSRGVVCASFNAG